jgi:hypothetical protein
VSLPESSSEEPRGVLVRRQKTTIFTVLLGIALAALVFGCFLMILELARYRFQYKPPTNLRSDIRCARVDLTV